MRYLLRRIGFYLVAVWAGLTINFIIPRLAPGDPVGAMLARNRGRISPQAIPALEQQLGVSHAPLWQQYIQYFNNMLHGNLGTSVYYFPTPVKDVIGQDIWWTLMLFGVSVIISFTLGTLLGIVLAWRRGSLMDSIIPPVLTFLSAVPYFWLALLCLFFLGYTLNWFPISGGYDLGTTIGFTPDFILSAGRYALLPAITIVAVSLAGWLLNMRNTMITTLSEDYVLMAEAKGLPQRVVMLRYAARNAVLPNVTAFALTLGFVVGGQLVTEIVFSYPGIGYGLLQAVQNDDYPLLQGIFLMISLAVLVANFLADMAYAALDPRVRQEGS